MRPPFSTTPAATWARSPSVWRSPSCGACCPGMRPRLCRRACPPPSIGCASTWVARPSRKGPDMAGTLLEQLTSHFVVANLGASGDSDYKAPAALLKAMTVVELDG